MFLKGFFITVVFFSTLISIIFSLFIYEGGNYYKSRCDVVREIALDDKKIDYLDLWISNKLSDKKFINLLGNQQIVPLDIVRNELVDSIDLDLEFIGFEKESSYVSFNVALGTSLKEGASIQSVSVGSGRFGILLSFVASAGEGLITESLRYEKVSERVYINCG